MTDIDSLKTQVEANRKARDAARLVWDLAVEEEAGLNQRGQEEFWRTLVGLLKAVHPKLFVPNAKQPTLPMTDIEAKRFGHTTMLFGHHRGVAVKDIPLEYFDWLAAQPNFHKQLNRYLRSDYVAREQSGTSGD